MSAVRVLIVYNRCPLPGGEGAAVSGVTKYARTARNRPGSAEDLAQHIGWAETHSGAMRVMGTNARRKYEDEFTPDRNYERMMAIYHDAITAAKLVTQPSPQMRTAG